jgi:hypothetical protein
LQLDDAAARRCRHCHRHLQIATDSTLASRQGTVSAFASGQRVGLNNAGTIDLSAGNDGAGRLLVSGDYNGDNGVLRLNSVLGQDDAASDRLVISGGHQWLDRAVGQQPRGPGAATQSNGIQVVEARDGATSNANAFIRPRPCRPAPTTTGCSRRRHRRQREQLVPALDPGRATPPRRLAVERRNTPPVAAPARPGKLARPGGRAGHPCTARKWRCTQRRRAAPRSSCASGTGTFHQRQGDQQWLDATAAPASWGQPTAARFASNGAAPSARAWTATCTASRWARTCMPRHGRRLPPARRPVRQPQPPGRRCQRLRPGREDRPVGDLELEGDSLGAYWTWVGPARATWTRCCSTPASMAVPAPTVATS